MKIRQKFYTASVSEAPGSF